MTSFTCLIATVLIVITFPVIVLLHITESRHTRIQRWRRQGQTWKQIGERLNCSPSTAKRWSIA